MLEVAEILRRIGVGKRLVAWAADAPDLEAVFHACPRGDWLMELALAVHVDRRRAVRAALECAERARRIALPADTSALGAVEMTRRWLGQRASGAQCFSAGFAASQTAHALPDGSPEQHAALSAASTAHACDADASPVYYAQRAHPVRAIAHATLAQPTPGAAGACADAVRTHIPFSVLSRALPEAIRRSAPPPAAEPWEVEGGWYSQPGPLVGTPPPE